MKNSIATLFIQRAVWVWVSIFAIPISVLGYLAGASLMDAYQRRNNPEILEFSGDFILYNYTMIRYWNASYADAKRGLQYYSDFLSKRNSGTIIYSVELCQFYKMLTFARIAKVEERQNNIALAEQAWRQAELLASQAHLKDITRKHLELVLNQNDSYYFYLKK